MDSAKTTEGPVRNQMPAGSFNNGSNYKHSSEVEAKSTSGPTVLFLWVWNWFAGLPKTVTNLYADFKNGELLSRFTLLDAMLQFIVAVATSCHPQEEGMGPDADEYKSNEPSTPSKSSKDVKVFGGAGRTLRSRTIETNS